jgi:MFS family permease
MFIFSNSMLSFGISSIEVFLGLYFLELKFREDFIGTYYAVSTGTSAVLLLLAGRLSDRIGRTASFYITLAGHFAGYSLLFMYQSRAAIFWCAFINGASAALRACTSAPFIHENARASERDYVYSAAASYMLMGAMFGNVFGGYLPITLMKLPSLIGAEKISAAASYRYSILISMTLILVSALPLLRITKNAPDGASSGSAEKNAFRRAAREYEDARPLKSGRRLYAKFVTYTFLIGCGAGLIVPFFNIYFARKFGLDSGRIGVIFMLANILTAVSMMMTPAITIRYGKIRSIVFMELASLPFLLTLGLSGSFSMCVVSYLMRNALMNMNNPVFTNFIMENTDKDQRGRVNSIVTLGDNFSRTVSTYISGRLMTDHGVGLPYFITAGFYLAAALFAYFSFSALEREMKKREAA